MRARRAGARVAIENAARQKQPQKQIAGAEPENRWRPPFRVEQRAQIVEHRRESDDGGLERLAERARLCGELGPPLIVHAARGLLGGQAAAEVGRAAPHASSARTAAP